MTPATRPCCSSAKRARRSTTPKKFAFGGVYPATLEDKSELTKENLEMLAKKSGCGRVVVEYNGMWMLNDLAAAMPDNWVIYQCIATADGSTFKLYANDNAMRSLLLDKVAASELIVLNRAENVNDEESREFVHKVVRQASRRCDIAYEFADGSVAYDDIPDPLPFDIEAPVIEIADQDFGVWYMDCSETPEKVQEQDRPVHRPGVPDPPCGQGFLCSRPLRHDLLRAGHPVCGLSPASTTR